MPWIIGGAIFGSALLGGSAAKSAASTQADAANKASDNTMKMYDQNRTDLAPYRSLGAGSTPSLIEAMGYTPQFDSQGNLTGMTKNPDNMLQQQFNGGAPFSFNPSDLEKYPGYQFALQQGMRGVNASAAAKGLGVSAGNIRGAADYASGLASQTYGNAYNQALGTYQTNYGNALNTFNTNYTSAAQNANRLAGLVQTGQNSATQTAAQGLTATGIAGNFATSGAAATAAGTVGAANALTGALGTGINTYMQQQYLNKMPNNALPGGGSGTNTSAGGNWFTSTGEPTAAAYGG